MKKILLLLITAINGLGAFSQTLADVVQPENRYDYFFLEAMVERQRGNSDAAFDLLTHCVEINPNAPEAYYYLAQYYHSMKNQDKAQEYLKRAAALSPDNAIFLETLAQLIEAKAKTVKEAAEIIRDKKIKKDEPVATN